MEFLNPSFSPVTVLRYAVALVVFVSVIFAIIYSLWGGFLLITSGWNEEKVKPAVNHIRHAFLWLIVLVIALFTMPKIHDLFGMPNSDVIAPSVVFRTIREISSQLFNGTSAWNIEDTSTNIDELPSNFSDL